MSERFSRRLLLETGLRIATLYGLNTLVPPQTASADNTRPVSLSAQPRRPPVVGAIRWDGWFEGSRWPANLQGEAWKSRLPFFAEIDSNGGVKIFGDRQEVMDQEIEFAKFANLDYWAFCYYEKDSLEYGPYNYGLSRYLASTVNSKPAFALIIQGTHVGQKSDWDNFANDLVNYFQDDKYQKIQNRRPLLFIHDTVSFNKVFGAYDQTNNALNVLRNKAVKQGLGSPFIIGQNVSGELVHLEFDALGAYSANGSGQVEEQPYSLLIQSNVDYSEFIKELKKQVVPLLNIGWDPRPRLHIPEINKFYLSPWYTQPTFDDIIRHLNQGLEWIDQNPAYSSSRLLLLFAWNELGENGRLIPGLIDGTYQIEAVRSVLEPLKGKTAVERVGLEKFT